MSDPIREAGSEPESPPKVPDGIVLTAEEKRRRRSRNVAIGWALFGLVVLFYIVTVVKLGPGVLNRPI